MRLSREFQDLWRVRLAASALLAAKRRAVLDAQVTQVLIDLHSDSSVPGAMTWSVDIQLDGRSIRVPIDEMHRTLEEYAQRCDLALVDGEKLSSLESSRRGNALQLALVELLRDDFASQLPRLSESIRSLQRRVLLDFVSAQSDLVTEEDVVKAWRAGLVDSVHDF
jgi:hypothetical protein